MTSNIFPWCTFYTLQDLPDDSAIADELAFAGKLARAYDQRLTFHPSHFVKVAAAAAQEDLLQRSIKELEVHSQVPALVSCLPTRKMSPPMFLFPHALYISYSVLQPARANLHTQRCLI